MPHLVLEYNAALDTQIDMSALCKILWSKMQETGAFGDGSAIRVRAIPIQHFHVVGDQMFANGMIRLLPGRDVALKSKITHAVLSGLIDALPGVQNLSVDIKEIDPDVYAKPTP